MRQAVLEQVARRDLAAAFHVDRPAFSALRRRPLGWLELGGLFDRDDAFRGGDKPAQVIEQGRLCRAASPEISRLRRPSTQAIRKSAISDASVPSATMSSNCKTFGRKRRMERVGPRRASGAMTAFNREPSGSWADHRARARRSAGRSPRPGDGSGCSKCPSSASGSPFLPKSPPRSEPTRCRVRLTSTSLTSGSFISGWLERPEAVDLCPGFRGPSSARSSAGAHVVARVLRWAASARICWRSVFVQTPGRSTRSMASTIRRCSVVFNF